MGVWGELDNEKNGERRWNVIGVELRKNPNGEEVNRNGGLAQDVSCVTPGALSPWIYIAHILRIRTFWMTK